MVVDFNNLNINNLDSKTEFEEKVIFFINEWVSPSEKVKVQTSGSTGIPKVFEIEKSKMLNSAKMTCRFLGLREGNTALLCLPVEYISGKMMIVRSFQSKLKLLVANPALKPLENFSSQVDFCAMTPLQVENSLDKIHLIKNLIIGGAQVSESLKLKIKNKFNDLSSETKIFETYGMSETLSHIALKEIFPASEEYFTLFKSVDITKDERDCLQISAPLLNSDVLQTNDVVELKNEHQFKFLGRLDNIINSGGAKIFPEELEKLVKKEIASEVVFLGMKDEVLGQKLIAVVEGNHDQSILDVFKDIPFTKKFHHPKDILFVPQIPRTPNNKVNRMALLALLNN